MTRQKQFARRPISSKQGCNAVVADSQTEWSSPVENLLRDLAFVLHATAAIRQDMEVEQALCSTTP